jgi:hypothetical protein
MPEIVKLQNSLDPQQLYDEIPKIIRTSIQNGCDTVDYNIDQITVYFNMPMHTIFDDVTPAINANPKLKFVDDNKNGRVIGKYRWNDIETEWTFYIKNLDPDTKYRIVIPKEEFIDKEEKNIPQDYYELKFKTKPQK